MIWIVFVLCRGVSSPGDDDVTLGIKWVTLSLSYEQQQRILVYLTDIIRRTNLEYAAREMIFNDGDSPR